MMRLESQLLFISEWIMFYVFLVIVCTNNPHELKAHQAQNVLFQMDFLICSSHTVILLLLFKCIITSY